MQMIDAVQWDMFPPASAVSCFETPSDVEKDILAVGKLDAVPTILRVLCQMTGMGFAAVARVSEVSWTACAVQDNIDLGLKPGSQLPVKSTLCMESREARSPILIEHASRDSRYCQSPRVQTLESYISVPIVLENGRYFGNLYAVDPKPAKLSEPKILFMFSQFADLIALQIGHELLRDAERKAFCDERAAGDLREQFIAILGHDLRNPLHAIFAGGDMLERKLQDPSLASIVARIKISVRRMSSLIDDVLDFARGRLGAGIGIRQIETDDIGGGLTSVVKELQDAQPSRQILSNISVTRSGRCDLGRVQQIASNLIGNALTHGSSQTPVKVTAIVESDDLVLDVWNDGEPIPADSIDKIFEPFWRQSTSADRQGLGLGLHICSQIVRAHDGQLSVSSSQEGGTRFVVKIPIGRQRV